MTNYEIVLKQIKDANTQLIELVRLAGVISEKIYGASDAQGQVSSPTAPYGLLSETNYELECLFGEINTLRVYLNSFHNLFFDNQPERYDPSSDMLNNTRGKYEQMLKQSGQR